MVNIYNSEHVLSAQGSVVGIATGYELETEGLEFESRYGQEFSLLQIIQTSSGVHPTSYPMGTGGSFPGGKAAEREADHSPICLHGIVLKFVEHRSNFTLSYLSAVCISMVTDSESACLYYIFLCILRLLLRTVPL
jgi:hypothetical protein